MSKRKSYSELIRLSTFSERIEYLRCDSKIGEDTFGWRRWLNQVFYRSREWLEFKNEMIIRDNGCDLACKDYVIPRGVSIYMHHINSITPDDIINRASCLLDPENVITTVFRTHNLIHYGSNSVLLAEPIIRTPNDTCPWKK